MICLLDVVITVSCLHPGQLYTNENCDGQYLKNKIKKKTCQYQIFEADTYLTFESLKKGDNNIFFEFICSFKFDY